MQRILTFFAVCLRHFMGACAVAILGVPETALDCTTLP